MSARYEGLTPQEADEFMTGVIGTIVFEELDTARRMTPEDWEDCDIFHWTNCIAGAIYCAIQNRRNGAP